MTVEHARIHEASLHLVGYIRTSKDRRDHAEQLGAVRAAGCGRVFEDVTSDGRDDRPDLKAALDYLRPGDTLVVYSLSRLAGSVRHMLEIGAELEHRRVELKSLKDGIDTRTPAGRFTFVVLAAVAQLERDILIERTRDGLETARARGRVGGRPRLMTPERVAEAKQMLSRGCKIATVARTLGVSRASIYRTALYKLTPWGEEKP